MNSLPAAIPDRWLQPFLTHQNIRKMTLLEFIKSKLSEDSKLGDLARYIKGDLNFPSDKSEKQIISYLTFKTQFGGTSSTLKKLVTEFKKHFQNKTSDIDLDAKFALLRTENWKFLKEYFPVDKVVLVGGPTDYYKVYCIDTTNKKSLFFDLKSQNELNDISIIDEQKIHIGDLTIQASVSKAINLLENCSYDTPIKPVEKKIIELIEFLKLNN